VALHIDFDGLFQAFGFARAGVLDQSSYQVGNGGNYICKFFFVNDVVATLTWHPHNLPIYRSGVVALRLENLMLDKNLLRIHQLASKILV
jgi:hypothetical protein